MLPYQEWKAFILGVALIVAGVWLAGLDMSSPAHQAIGLTSIVVGLALGTNPLWLRRLRGWWMRRRLDPITSGNHGCCARCSVGWAFTTPHQTRYSIGATFAVLCESCWSELSPRKRWPYYEAALNDPEIPARVRTAVCHAVHEGK